LLRLGQRNAGRRYDSCHAQDFQIFDVADWRDQQSHILEQLYFFQRRISSQLRQRYLPWQAFERPQVRNQVLALLVVRIGIGVSGDFGDGIQRAFRRRVVAQDPVALAYLLQAADGIRLARRPVPHLLALNEERIPVVVVRVGTENPVVSLNGRKRH
jgi:hypothetical protein